MEKQTQGVVIGRFMPPHNGHRYLIDFAAAYADRVTVFVCTLSHEPIPGELRYQWMSEIFPSPAIRVVHITQEIPEASRQNPNSPQIWAQALLPYLDSPADYLFASEDYGKPLAQAFGALFIPVDPTRNTISTSATTIRQNPLQNWKYIPAPVRPYFVQLLEITPPEDFAPEDTILLLSQIASQLNTVFLPALEANRAGLAQFKALLVQARRFLVLSVDQSMTFSPFLARLFPGFPLQVRKIRLLSSKTPPIQECLAPFLEELDR